MQQKTRASSRMERAREDAAIQMLDIKVCKHSTKLPTFHSRNASMRVAAAAYASVTCIASLVDVIVRFVPGSVPCATCMFLM